MPKATLPCIVVGALVLAGCSSTGSGPPLSRSERLMSTACKDVVAVMTPHKGTDVIDLGMPFEKLIVAVDDAPNTQLRSELAAFQAAAATGGDLVSDSSAMLHTCERLGLGTVPR